MRTALIKLRDLSLAERGAHREAQQRLEILSQENALMKETIEKQSQEISELMQSVDDTTSAQQLVDEYAFSFLLFFLLYQLLSIVGSQRRT